MHRAQVKAEQLRATEHIVKVRRASYQPKGNRHGGVQIQGNRKESGKPVPNNRVQMRRIGGGT